MNNAKIRIAAGRGCTALRNTDLRNDALRSETRHIMHGQARYPRQGRRFGGQVLYEILNRLCRPLDFNGDSGGCIADRTSKAPAGGETINERTESNSLHNP
jgi:hypothetical protein